MGVPFYRRDFDEKESIHSSRLLSAPFKTMLLIVFLLGQCAVLGLASVAVFRNVTSTETVARTEAAESVITSDEYFWGQSPPVYPSRTSASLLFSRVADHTFSDILISEWHWNRSMGGCLHQGQGIGGQDDPG